MQTKKNERSPASNSPCKSKSRGPVMSFSAETATVRIRTADFDFRGGGCAARILVGKEERREVLRPRGRATRAACRKKSPLGPLEVSSLCWEPKDGVALTWHFGMLLERRGFTLQAAVRNGGDAPFRLAEFTLLDSAATRLGVHGDPAAWHLGGIDHIGGSLAEVLSSRNERIRREHEGFGMPVPADLPRDEKATDGHWRRHANVATLYTDRGARGLYMGAAGAESVVQFDWRVDGADCRLEVVGEMCDVRVDPGETRLSETALFLAEPCAEAGAGYARWLAAVLGARTHRGPVTGWCSWYDGGPSVTAGHVVSVAGAVAARRDRLPMQVIQIDDGWQRQAGDWECNDKFPDGWKPVVDAIRRAGATPGIWLGPLVAHEKVTFLNYAGEKENLKDGRLLDIHPDWFQRDSAGKLNGSAGNWGPTSYWLDPTHPGVRAFFRRIVRRMVQEGFRYFKIDFNHVAGRLHDPKKTHLQALRDLYRLYREEIGEDAYLLSCSGFNRATVGLADASRIGPDSCALWDAPHACCIRDCVPAVAATAFFNGVLYANDPDVTYTRPIWNITPAELRTWHGFVGLLGGTAMLSDHLYKPEYEAEETLRMFEILCPPAREHGVPLHPGADRMCSRFGLRCDRPWGAHMAVMIYNPAGRPADLALDLPPDACPGERFHAWSFWDGRYLGLITPAHTFRKLGPRESRLLRLTPPGPAGRPLIVGSDLHIAMGAAEFAAVRATGRTLDVELADAGATNGGIFFVAAGNWTLAGFTGMAQAALARVRPGLWRVVLRGRKRGGAQGLSLRRADARLRRRRS
ncbi:MAG: alpha-galactosidase [Lentisphaerae bacterium]|nr:alpha-galactosidase [Lentisphaerota bacterium]